MRRRKELARLLRNEGDVRLQPSSAGLQNKRRTWLPFVMMWTKVSEGQRQSNRAGNTAGADAQPQTTALGPAAALQAAGILRVPLRCSQGATVQDPVLK